MALYVWINRGSEKPRDVSKTSRPSIGTWKSYVIAELLSEIEKHRGIRFIRIPLPVCLFHGWTIEHTSNSIKRSFRELPDRTALLKRVSHRLIEHPAPLTL